MRLRLLQKSKRTKNARHQLQGIKFGVVIAVMVAGGYVLQSVYAAPDTSTGTADTTITTAAPATASDRAGVVTKNTGSTKSAKQDAAKKAAIAKEKATATSPIAAATPQPVAPTAAPAPVATAPVSWGGRPLYVQSHSNFSVQAAGWAGSRPADAAVMSRLAGQSSAKWFGGWNTNVTAEAGGYVGAAAASGTMPVLVAYNIPFRDCGYYSAGGAGSMSAYISWIQALAGGIANRPAVVVLEPDALGHTTDCLTAAQQQERYEMLKQATSILTAAGAYVYIEASTWVPAAEMATRLQKAGVAGSAGFAVNVSAFNTTAAMIGYGNDVSSRTGGKHFVIDTSRNGNGTWQTAEPDPWCNPPGRALGPTPVVRPSGHGKVDAFLWIKGIGESDGACRGAPAAGTWMPEYALGLARGAGW